MLAVKLTNQRVYQELVYRNMLLKTMLTGSAALSLPSPYAFFAFVVAIHAFPHYLGAWIRQLWTTSQAYPGYSEKNKQKVAKLSNRKKKSAL